MNHAGQLSKTIETATLAAAVWALLAALLFLAVPQAATAQEAQDFFNAVIVAPDGLGTVESNALEMLADEVAARSLARWKVQHQWPADDVPVVAVGLRDNLQGFAGNFAGEVPAA